MHANSEPREAEQLAWRFVEIFDGFDAIVTPSGSCAAQVREYFLASSAATIAAFLSGRGALAVPHRRARRRRGRVEVRGTVAYHPTCHSRLLRVEDAPPACCAVPGVEPVELPDERPWRHVHGQERDVSAVMLDEARVRRGRGVPAIAPA
jgi:L-lactate dehydrogenase complex protein LldE